MGRKILFITTDQQRYDSLGCNGGTIARTPVVDALARDGVNYRRAYNQNTVCMPARSTMLTGQYVRTHGVVANGVPLPVDAPSVAAYLHDTAGYRTALFGKAHFEPGFDLRLEWPENRMAHEGRDRSVPRLRSRRARGARTRVRRSSVAALRPLAGRHARPRGDEGILTVARRATGWRHRRARDAHQPDPREWYHTDWVADRTIAYLDSLPADADWFVWMSFPDPHHPWDPPASEQHRCNWRDLDLPPGHPGSNDEIERVLAQKPAHWLALWEGSFVNAEGGPGSYRPQSAHATTTSARSTR